MSLPINCLHCIRCDFVSTITQFTCRSMSKDNLSGINRGHNLGLEPKSSLPPPGSSSQPTGFNAECVQRSQRL